jgi:hypothetical protein
MGSATSFIRKLLHTKHISFPWFRRKHHKVSCETLIHQKHEKLLESVIVDEENSCYLPANGLATPLCGSVLSGYSSPSFEDTYYRMGSFNHLSLPCDDSNEDEYEILVLRQNFQTALDLIRNTNKTPAVRPMTMREIEYSRVMETLRSHRD